MCDAVVHQPAVCQALNKDGYYYYYYYYYYYMLHPVRLPVRLSRTFDLLIYSKSRVLSVSHGYFIFSGDMTLDTSIWVASLRSKGKCKGHWKRIVGRSVLNDLAKFHKIRFKIATA